MLTSNELAMILARDHDVTINTALHVVEQFKHRVTGLRGYFYDPDLDAWLSYYEKVKKEIQKELRQ